MKYLNAIPFTSAKPARPEQIAPGGLILLDNGDGEIDLAVCGAGGINAVVFSTKKPPWVAGGLDTANVIDLGLMAQVNVPDLLAALIPPGRTKVDPGSLALSVKSKHVICRNSSWVSRVDLATGAASQVSEHDWHVTRWQLGFMDATGDFVALFQLGGQS